ncbi:MAG TPA: TRAP transporter substrate-binding protein, partial [Alicycliphilus sp.]|nr:TRAP transporter substrate-binding protein [Alicycliphilus sp.]
MNSIFRTLAVAVSIAAALPVAVAQTKVRLGHVFAQGTPADLASQKFAALVKERTNGEVQITVFPNNQLGSDEALGRDLSRGTVEFAFLNPGSLAGLDPLLDIHYLPYIASTYAQVDKILYNPNGVLQKTLNTALSKQNMLPLAYFELEFRAVTNSKRPVLSPADLKGLKVRVPGSASIRSFFEAAGAQAVTMPFSNLFVALQQGTVDGQDNGASLTYSSRLFEAQKYMTLTNHVYAMGAVTASQRFWGKLSEKQREVITQAAREAAAEEVKNSRAMNNEYLEKIAASG